MLSGRAALLPLSSVLHRSAPADALARPLLGRTLLDHQLRLLRQTGHDLVVLIGLVGTDLPPIAGPDVRVARSADEAASLLKGAGAVTLLGHGVLMFPSLLLDDGPGADGLLVRSACPGWERIDADRAWAGALRLPDDVMCGALTDLGDWDVQATLLRVAVQRDGPQRWAQADQLAIGLQGDDAAILMMDEARRVLSSDGGLISRRLQRGLHPVALALAHRSVMPIAEVVTALLASGSIAAALLARPAIAFALGLLTAITLSLAMAGRRLRQARRGTSRVLSLLALASVPTLSAVMTNGVMGGLLGLALSGTVMMSAGRHDLPPWARLDVVFAVLTLGTLVQSAMVAVVLALLALTVAPLSRPGARRRVGRLVLGPMD